MNISYKWLNEFISLPESPEEIGKLLTGTGLEVEAIEKIESIPGGLAGVIIGEVLTCQRHPDADKLSITTVDVGTGEVLNIVCGAPNVATGQKVVVATVGATLHPTSGEPFAIKKAKIRGAASEGMICAEDEIGLGTSHAGILVLDTQLPNGTPAVRYFNLEADYQIVIGLTPNRIDAASHLGTARDLKAVLNRAITIPSVDEFRVDNQSLTLDVQVENPADCPRYAGLTMSGLTVGESPEWLKKRLIAIGLNPINNVVDVTNFICHDLGQPLHAFDADQIMTGADGVRKIVVKTLPEGTPFITLDGVERKLTATDLMICDAGKPPADAALCIAGVFGGKTSGVTAKTTRVFLESAHFSAASVRKTAQHHGLKTDASFRFERGTDPDMPVFALKRAALLLQEVAGGVVSSDIVDLYPNPVEPFRVLVHYKNIDRLIGIKLDHAEIHRILEALDISAEDRTDTGFTAIVPPYRVDVTREADVIEEILRIYGIDNIPLSAMLGAESLSEFPAVDSNQMQSRVGQLLAANGFFETLTLSLTRPAYHDAIRQTLSGHDVRLLNPLSDELSVMRQTMLFSALDTIVHNLNRRQRDLKLFDFGKVYFKTESGKYIETPRLSIALTGNRTAETWQHKAEPVAFQDLSAAVQRVLNLFRIRSTNSQPTDSDLFQYSLTYAVQKKPLVSFGLVHPKLLKLTDCKQPVFYADFDWELLLNLYDPKARYQEVSRFPEVRRDLSVVLPKAVSFEQVSRVAAQTERKLLQAVNVFDVYEGEKLDVGQKSYSVSFVLQDPAQTLTDAVIDKTMQRLMAGFERELGAVIRK